MESLLDVVNLLRKTRQRLVRDGWVKERGCDPLGKRCVSNAISYESILNHLPDAVVGKVHEVLVRASNQTKLKVMGYNDRVCQTLEGDVLPWIDRSIQLALEATEKESAQEVPTEEEELVLA